MTTDSMNGKTAVFSLGSITRQAEPRSYDMDEPTRELPLIAGRFAGREWVVEDLQREFVLKQEKKRETPRPRAGLIMAACAILALVLLVGSLFGQAKLVDMNEEALAASSQITELEKEQRSLRLQYEELRRYPGAAALSAGTVDRTRELTAGTDKATVLNLRHGNEMPQLWRAFIDKLGESFR